jgi:L-amino acid N-acyltransferase YncA
MAAPHVRPVEGLDSGSLAALFAGHPFPPYRYLPGVERGDSERYAAGVAAEVLAAEGAWKAVWEEKTGGSGSPMAGLAVYQEQPWDSGVLSRRAGRVSLLDLRADLRRDRERALAAARGLSAAVMERIRGEADYVTARVDARDVIVAVALQEAGFQVIDGIVKFAFDLRDPIPAHTVAGFRMRPAHPGDLKALVPIAETSFVYDRFHNDPAIPTAVADRLHGDWVTNAVEGRFGRGIVVAESEEGEVAGFSMFTEDASSRERLPFPVGIHTLLGVGASFRRKGLSKALFVEMMRRLRDLGNRFVESGTQIANLPSFNMHLAVGYRPVQTSLSMRWDGRGPGPA